MVLCDVSVLLYACTPRSKHHKLCHRAVQGLVDRAEPFAVSELLLAAVVRIATNARIFQPPASADSVFTFTDALRSHPRSVTVAPGARHWQIFKDLVLTTGVTGGDTTDAYFAALAMEHGCDWWTTDADFDRFESLRSRNLLIDPRE